jgi:hypothetical protein
MKTFPFVLLLLVSLTSFSQPKSKPKVYELPAKTWPTQAVTMDNVVASIRFVPLETTPSCLVGEINGLCLTDKGIYILTRDMKLLCFDLSGKFIWSINRKGEGPGEYVNLRGFTVTDKELVLMDSRGKKLIFFSLDGKYIREINKITTGFNIAYLGNERLAMGYGRANTSQDHKGQLSIVKLNGTIENSYFPFDRDEGMGMFSSFTTGSDGKVFYHADLDPTIYEISGKAIDTLLRYDFKLPVAHSFREVGLAAEHVGIRRIMDTKTSFAAKLESKEESVIWLKDNKSGNSKLFYVSGPGGTLGTCHGFPIYAPSWSGRNEFIDINDGVQMKEILGKINAADLAWLRKNAPGFSVIEKVNEDDNPVLVLCQFKEF